MIRSFNTDKPFDRFVLEQLAGDEMAGFKASANVTPDMYDALIATHFLRNGPDGTGERDGNPDEVHSDKLRVLEGTFHITMSSLLGITIQCARCHDHKFERVSQKEYYSLQAIFSPGYNPDKWRKPIDRSVAMATRAERNAHRQATERVDQQLEALRKGLKGMAKPWRTQLVDERLQSLDQETRTRVITARNVPQDKRNNEQNSLLETHNKLLQVNDDDLAKRFPAFASAHVHIQKAIGSVETTRPAPLERISCFLETDPDPPPHHVLVRGQHKVLGNEVTPDVPVSLCTAANTYQL